MFLHWFCFVVRHQTREESSFLFEQEEKNLFSAGTYLCKEQVPKNQKLKIKSNHEEESENMSHK
jgi:hypothetical protein